MNTYDIVKTENGDILNVGDMHTFSLAPESYSTEQIVGVSDHGAGIYSVSTKASTGTVRVWHPATVGLEVRKCEKDGSTYPESFDVRAAEGKAADRKEVLPEIAELESVPFPEPDFSEEDRQLQSSRDRYERKASDYNEALEAMRSAHGDLDSAFNDLRADIEAARDARNDYEPEADEVDSIRDKMVARHAQELEAFEKAVKARKIEAPDFSEFVDACDRVLDEIEICDEGDEADEDFSAADWDDITN